MPGAGGDVIAWLRAGAPGASAPGEGTGCLAVPLAFTNGEVHLAAWTTRRLGELELKGFPGLIPVFGEKT